MRIPTIIELIVESVAAAVPYQPGHAPVQVGQQYALVRTIGVHDMQVLDLIRLHLIFVSDVGDALAIRRDNRLGIRPVSVGKRLGFT